jgi:hypothetical protein
VNKKDTYLEIARGKEKRFSTARVEYEEKEVRDLLALERPKKKKDYSKVLCFNCKKIGHYAKKYPERNNKVNKQRGTNLVTCQKCNQKGHYAGRLRREKYFETLVSWNNRRMLQTQGEDTTRSSQLGSNCIQLLLAIKVERTCKNND